MDHPPASGRIGDLELRLTIANDSEGTWELLEMTLDEALSRPFECEILAAVDTRFPDLMALLGSRASVWLRRDGLERALHGIIVRAEEMPMLRDERAVVRLSVAPELWLLSKRRDSRIFKDETLPEIVRDVLDRAGLYPGDRLVMHLETNEPHTHVRREYCVQYQETDLDFLRRLLEEEGSTFYLAHDSEASAEKLVIVDGTRAMLDETYTPLDNGPDGGAIRYVVTDRAEVEHSQTMSAFQWASEVRSNAVALHDHDFTQFGNRDHMGRAARSAGANGRALEVYEHPARFLATGYPPDAARGMGSSLMPTGDLRGAAAGRLLAVGGETLGEAVALGRGVLAQLTMPRNTGHSGRALATARLQEEDGRRSRFSGRSVVIGLMAGTRFSLTGHPRGDLDVDYVVTRVVHQVRSPSWGDQVEPQYANRLECIPRNVPHRPLRTTPRPRIAGTQTATVVGGPGEEMHVDAHGRVRVQMTWDRQNACETNLPALSAQPANPFAALGASGAGDTSGLAHDPALVCWARCAQSWAGPQWGSHFIPRVGMEVVVTFLDGDPDKPLVVGCVYNSANPPPYPLPDQHHRSTIRTRSIPAAAKPPGREGFNELRFEDLANHEQIYLHAEKDLTEVVRDHHETWVGGSQDNEVARHQTNRVRQHQQESIGGNRTVGIARNDRLTVGRSLVHSVEGAEIRSTSRGRLTEVGDFDAELFRGKHVHWVAPFGAPPDASDPLLADVMEEVRTVMTEAGQPAPPAGSSEGSGGGGSGDDAPGGDEGDDADLPDGAEEQALPAAENPLETYVVQGDRVKRVEGLEQQQIQTRSVRVDADDMLVAGGRVLVNGAEVSLTSTDGQMAALTLADTRAVMLHQAGGELSMSSDAVELLRNGDQRIVQLDGEGIRVESAEGRVLVVIAANEDEGGMEIDADGARVVLYTREERSDIKLDRGVVTINARTAIRLKCGASSIELDHDGRIDIKGTVFVTGHLNTSG